MKQAENEKLGVPRDHPEFRKLRRARFVSLLREAKRVLKLSPRERLLVIELCKLIERDEG